MVHTQGPYMMRRQFSGEGSGEGSHPIN